MARNDDREITFEIVEELGVLSKSNTGWTKELNRVEWNGGNPKYDIREWDPDHSRMSRGVTLKEEEMERLVEIMKMKFARSDRTAPSESRSFESTSAYGNASAYGNTSSSASNDNAYEEAVSF